MMRNSMFGWMLLLGCAPLLGADPPAAEANGSSVAVVYNRRFEGSQDLAQYYALRRGVPADQIFGLDLPTDEAISRDDFRKRLQNPLLKALERRKLLVFPAPPRRSAPTDSDGSHQPWVETARIRYLVLSAGVPVKVLHDPNLVEDGLESLPEELRRNDAAVDAELAILPRVERSPRLAGPLSNPGYDATNTAQLGPTAGLLMVARLDGPDLPVARRLVDQAMEAERNGLWGRAYLDLRGLTNTVYVQGERRLAGAGSVLHRAGFETVWDTESATFAPDFPMSQIGFYAGWYDATVSGPFQVRPVEFMPGAFAYHLHSFSARTLRTRDSGWVGPLLDRGATATVGYVEEPYLSGTLDVATFTARWVTAGWTYGEAVYAGLPFLSWQSTVVGDPLYRPFGRAPDAHLGERFRDLHFQLVAQQSPLLEWSHLHVVNLGLSGRMEVPPQEIVDYLQTAAAELRSAVLAEKLADVLRTAGRPQPALAAYRQALQWGGSRQQRVRILLALAELQESLSLAADALETYESLIAQFADHPARTTALPRALGLARRLERADAVARLEATLPAAD